MSIRATILGVLAVVAAAPALADERERTWLDAHNAERSDFGVAPLTWSDKLARDAQQWARHLARQGTMRHSSSSERDGQGENLWMGSAGYFRPEEMIEHLASERQFFRAGRFPEVSRTGNWADVGHYTQIVWAETREVGCATARGERFDYLVCRYSPAGNVIGQRIEPQRRIARR